MTTQRDEFVAGEADQWFARNATTDVSQPPEHIATLLSSIAPGSAVLEVGCADGRNLAALDAQQPGRGVLCGVDPSQLAIDAGRARWPRLDLRVGTADALPFPDDSFDVVVLGFFLYLCDRVLLPRIVYEADRVLRDGGMLAIIDFDPPHPRRRTYHHRPGMWSYKMDYSTLFLAFPSYVLERKVSFSHAEPRWTADETERVALHVLRKQLAGGYSIESSG